MEMGRKKLPHHIPPEVVPDPEHEVYFITICCEPRGLNQPALPEVWQAIRETVEVRQTAGDWEAFPDVAMPDHLHALIAFPGRNPMEKVIGTIKAWLAKSRESDGSRDSSIIVCDHGNPPKRSGGIFSATRSARDWW